MLDTERVSVGVLHSLLAFGISLQVMLAVFKLLRVDSVVLGFMCLGLCAR